MGKKRADSPAPQSRPKKASAVGPNQPKPNAITIRGSEAWKKWLERLAARLGLKPTALINLALAEIAARVGFEEAPPRV